MFDDYNSTPKYGHASYLRHTLVRALGGRRMRMRQRFGLLARVCGCVDQ